MDDRSRQNHPVKLRESTLRAQLSAADLIDATAPWHRFSGGRTNSIWRIGDCDAAVVCKLFSAAADSPLFPNEPAAEARALSALAGTGLAPHLIGLHTTTLGPCLLYHHVAGRAFNGDPARVAEILTRLHHRTAPGGLRRIEAGADALRRQGLRILDDCTSSDADALRSACPRIADGSMGKPVFLHGDLVPANIICNAGGLTLIDWQCPAIGDASEDLATFLSPAMQSLYGGRRLDEAERSRFLANYGNAEAVQTYRVLEPLYRWRMATHCLWKSQRGSSDYGTALHLELAELQQL